MGFLITDYSSNYIVTTYYLFSIFFYFNVWAETTVLYEFLSVFEWLLDIVYDSIFSTERDGTFGVCLILFTEGLDCCWGGFFFCVWKFEMIGTLLVYSSFSSFLDTALIIFGVYKAFS